MFCFIKKYFCFSHDFKTWLHNADHLLYILFSYFCYLLISVCKKRDIARILTLPCWYKWQKMNKMNEKWSLLVSECECWICNWWNYWSYSAASFQTILLFDFCSASKILICCNLIKCFPNDCKTYSSHL